MRNKSTIRIFSEPRQLTIIDRARYITEKQALISEYFDKYDWCLFDKTQVEIRDTDKVIQLFLKRIKKNIAQATIFKNVNDDYIDTTKTVEGFYASKKFDDDASFTYRIGIIDEYNTVSSLIINNFHCLKGLDNSNELKKFIGFIVDVFQPYSIQVSESLFYRDLLDLRSDEYWFGWMTYFSKDVKLPQIPPDVKVEELSNGGKLLITTEDFFTSDNPEHVRKAKSLVELFRGNYIRA